VMRRIMNDSIEVPRNGDASAAMTSRRALLGGAALIAGVARAQDKPAVTAGKLPAASPAQPIAEAVSGKVRGFAMNGVYAFKGIPYGAPTSGAARFRRPSKPEPWAGVRSCVHYGHMCPNGFPWSQPGDNAPHGDEDAFLLYRAYFTPSGEDCLRLNVWTPGLSASTRKRPVLVYMHGGGFSGGSGHDLLAYDGENLARGGDVVVVTHNHRLNVFGYLNLAEAGGEEYADSGNVGALDLVAVLEWVRDNISNFGGDPGNVTIFGQSGGGGKVAALMTMPAANGLFHKAINQSGPFLRFATTDDSALLANAVLSELNIAKPQLARIRDVPIDQLAGAAQAALRKVARPAEPGSVVGRIGWGPVVDGRSMPAHPFDPAAPAISAHVPLLLGTNLNEAVSGVDNPEVDTLTAQQLQERVSQRWGARGRDIVEAYRREYPKATPFGLWAAISAASWRQIHVTQGERKAALGGAPAYQYIFSWRTPVLEGRPGTFHACEIAFVFDNAGLCIRQTGGGPAALSLSRNVSQAWVHFARSGNPNHAGLPNWPVYDAAKHATMFFDSPCFVRNNPEGEGLRLIRQAT
jgi:para-nitrobenzyl esterase